MAAVFGGRRPDRLPVTISYTPLMQREHWEEITGQPAWTWHRWCYTSPDEHLEGYRELDKALPLDVIEPLDAPPLEVREHTRVVRRPGGCSIVNTRTGEERWVTEDLAHVAPAANEKRSVFTRRDADERIRVVSAERAIAAGVNDYRAKVVETMGPTRFILSGGVTGAFWGCTGHLGETNLLTLVRDDPQLVDYLCARILEQHIERIRVLCAAGGDAVFIDDALTTSEMISLADYERFSMPYVRRMVEEIHAHGMKAIVIYFGGVADRLEHIASLGADGLMVETSMKSYTNDIGEIAETLGGRMVLFGNIDPVNVIWRGSDAELQREVARQAAVGRRYGRFVMCTGSPVTPATPLARIRRFIDLAGGASTR